MPVLADPARWRSHPHTVDQFLYILKPDVVFAASVNQSTFTYPVVVLSYDNVTVGAYTDVRLGQLVRISDSDGNLKDYSRIRLAPTSSQVYLATIGQGDIDLENNDLIEVLDDFRPMTRLPRIDDSNPRKVIFYKDYDLAYSDQGSKPNPVCNAGSFVIRRVDDETGLITVERDLTNSFATAAGATISSYSGNIGDGTVVSGSIASGTFTATFPAGKRWCHFTAIDSNGKTHTKHILVVATERTGENAPIRVVVKQLNGTLTDGWQATFTLLADTLNNTVIEQGALVLFYVEETYDGVDGSLNGAVGTENLQFMGWITSDSVNIDPLFSDVDIVCAGPVGLMRALPGFNQSLTNKASPSNWNQIKNLTPFMQIWYLLYWHTTILDICDIERPTWVSTYPYSSLASDEADPYSQADVLAQYVTAKLTADRAGLLYLRQNPIYMSDADRDDVVVTVALQAKDWKLINQTSKHQRPIYWLRASALVASASKVTALLAISPGVQPGYGAIADTLEKQLVTGQSELNTRAGHVYAERINLTPRISIDILTGGMVADPAWREWIELTLDADSNRRGIAYASTRFIVEEISVSMDAEVGATEESWSMENETRGVPAVTQVVPKDKSLNPSVMPLPPEVPIEIPSPIITPVLNFIDSPAIYAWSHKNIGRLRKGSSTWQRLIQSADMGTGFADPNILTVRLDPWNPKNRAYAVVIQGVNDTMKVVQIDNLDNDTPLCSVIFSPFDVFGVDARSAQSAGNFEQQIDLSINVQGMVGILASVFPLNKTTYIWRTTDGGTWHTKDLPDIGSGSGCIVMGHHAPGASSGRVYALVSQGPVAQLPTIDLSTDQGANWSEDETISHTVNVPAYVRLDMPYADNPEDRLIYASASDVTIPDDVNLVVRRNADGSYTDITPILSGAHAVAQDVVSFTNDRQQVAIVAIAAGYIATSLMLTLDAGATWAVRNGPSGSPNGGDIGGWPYDREVLLLAGTDHHFYVTDNFVSGGVSGVTWTDITLDFFTTASPNDSTALGLVPVWVS